MSEQSIEAIKRLKEKAKGKTFDDLFQESHDAQRKFAARVTVYGAPGESRYPLPKQFGRYGQTPRDTSNAEGNGTDRAEGREPTLSPTSSGLNEYEDIMRDDWQPNLGPPNTPKFSQDAQSYYDWGPKRFEAGATDKESEAFINPVSTHVNPLSKSAEGGGQWHDLISSAKKATSSAQKVLKEEDEARAEPEKTEDDAEEGRKKPFSGWKGLQRQWQFTQQIQKNRNPAVNAALLSDYRIANIRLLSMQLFRALDKEEYGFITYVHVNNMKSAVWGWRGEATAQKDLNALTVGEGGSSGVDEFRDTLIISLQRALKHFNGKLTVDEFVWYIVNAGIPQPYNSVDLHHALEKATTVMTASPSYQAQYGIVVVPGLMVINAVVTCVLTYHAFIEAVPSTSDYFKDGACSGEGRWIDFSKLKFGSIGSGKIDSFAYIIPGILAIVQMVLVTMLFVFPKCKRRIFGAAQDFQDTTEHKQVRKDLAQLIVVENEFQQGTIGLQKVRSLVFGILCAVSVVPLLLLVLVIGGIDKEFSNDYHTLYFLCASYLVATLVIFIRAVACVKPVGPDALVAIHRDRNLLLSYPVKLPYDPDIQNALDVWMRLEESLGKTESFFARKAGLVFKSLGSRIVAVIVCLSFALSPLVMLAIQPGSCFGKGSLDHPVATVLLGIVLLFASLVFVSDLFDIAAIHRKKTNAFKKLGSLLVAKEAVEAKLPYLSAAASPQNLAAFNAMKIYLLSHFLIGDAVQTGRESRSIGWAVSETVAVHFVVLAISIFSAVFQWRVVLYFSLALLLATSYFLLGFNSTGSFSAAISMQRCLARMSKVLLSEASKMQVSSYNVPSDTESVRYPAAYLQNTVRALELFAKSCEVMPEQMPRSIGITLNDRSISLLRILSMSAIVAAIVIASLTYD